MKSRNDRPTYKLLGRSALAAAIISTFAISGNAASFNPVTDADITLPP